MRDGLPGDGELFARCFAELGVDDPLPSWEKVRPECFFVEVDGQAAGYGQLRLLDGIAHVCHVVTLPAFRGQGVGRAILDEMRRRAAGCASWYLNVKPDNAVAIRLYERCGFTAHHRGTSFHFPWTGVDALPLAVLPPSLDLEEATRQFGLAPGLLAARERQGYALFLHPGALAAFDPSFPGANPFLVPRLELLRALLERMRAMAQHDYVRLMVENDDALTARLVAVGASPVLEILQMRGKP